MNRHPTCEVIREDGLVCGEPISWFDPGRQIWCCEKHSPHVRKRPRCAARVNQSIVCGAPGAWQRPDTREWLCLQHVPDEILGRAQDYW